MGVHNKASLHTEAAVETLERLGILLEQDKRFPSVVSLVTGESLRTSWWSHPEARLIFRVISDLTRHPDVLFTKLLQGKVTLVHRRLWPPFFGVVSARRAWQLKGLSAAGRRLLAVLEDADSGVRSSGPAVKELEVRLLAHSDEIHSESGRHEIVLESWHVWAARVGVDKMTPVDRAYRRLEEAVLASGAPLSALPWSK